MFFPVGDPGSGLVVEQVARAKAVCARCPVRSRCLGFALVAIPEGVAGGLSEQERRELRGHREGVGEQAAVPVGVDEVVVELLVAGVPMSGASVVELAAAAVRLHLVGRRPGWIAARLGVDHQVVRRWLQRYRAGEPVVGSRVERLGRVSA